MVVMQKKKLVKEECKKCGTIRTQFEFDLGKFYLESYKPTRNIDTVSIVNDEEINRSQFIYDWVLSLIPQEVFERFDSIFEIGCGQGYLLDKFTINNKFGVEPSKEASIIASKIAKVKNIGYEKIDANEKYDFTLSYCVIEHVENPNNFIQKNFKILNKNGYMCIALPIQDKFNYDLCFADHLHHIHHKNFITLLNNNGFEVVNFELGKGSYYNIGIYICRKKLAINNKSFKYINNHNVININTVLKTIKLIINKYGNNKLYAFGYGEIAKTILPYTDMDKYILSYIDDYSTGGKVITSKLSKQLFIDMKEVNIILLINPMHINKIKNIYKKYHNINFINIFNNIEMEFQNELE
jgi:SAM-dependent methyltransferase